jgi:hypothetical protein
MSEYDKFPLTPKQRLARFARRYLSTYLAAGSGGGKVLSTLMSSQSSSNKRKRLSQDLSQSSITTTENALETIHHRHELVDRKRLPPVVYRLHAAKYLVMDKMLKSMFFPLMTTKLRFGMSSFSGTNILNAQELDDVTTPTPLEKLRARGLFRGLVMFNVRNTDGAVTRSTTNALNAKNLVVGSYSGDAAAGGTIAGDIFSTYRRFHSQPKAPLTPASDGSKAINQLPVFTEDDTADSGTIRTLDLGTNLSDIEENAVAGMCYADPSISQFRLRSVTGASETQELAANTGLIAGESGPVVQSANLTYTGPDQQNYFTHLENMVVRIVDGFVHLDIMNTEQTPCVVEVVIHSKKKNDLSKAQCFNQLYQDVNRYVRGKAVVDSPDGSSQQSGGWQAFWDPSYPLLKVPSGSRCQEFMTEVHRSNHVLAPGQSKLVKVKLGSLWYKLGNKANIIDDDYDGSTAQQFPKFKWNAGSLFFTVGHSGFEYPQNAAALPLTNPTIITAPGTSEAQLGSGFWVGKSHAPSSISIDAQYEDKYYPCTVDRSTNPQFNSGMQLVARTNAGYAIPAATIIPQRVAASPGVVQDIA